AIDDAEDNSRSANTEGESKDGDGGEAAVFAKGAESVEDIHEKVFNGRPPPDRAAVFLNQSYIPKLAPCPRCSFLPGHSARNQLLNLLFKVLPNLFGQLTVASTSRKQSLQPHHDSPGANTRVIPSSIFSNRDTSCSRCFAPFAVSLYVRTRRFVDEVLHSAFTNSSLRSRWSAG